MADRRPRRTRGEIRPIAGYDRIGYECLRCSVCFMSADGPHPFCPTCRKVIGERVIEIPGGRGKRAR